MSREDAVDLLDTMEIGTAGPATRQVKIGTVQARTTAMCQILFDGETVTGSKWYPCLGSYSPTVADRVVVLPVGSRTSWIVLGKIQPGP